jgi:hypothetical protein
MNRFQDDFFMAEGEQVFRARKISFVDGHREHAGAGRQAL